MAVRHELQIEIAPDGSINLRVKGVPGMDCLDLTKALEEELGVVVDRQKTSEYYQAEVNAETTVKIGEE